MNLPVIENDGKGAEYLLKELTWRMLASKACLAPSRVSDERAAPSGKGRLGANRKYQADRSSTFDRLSEWLAAVHAGDSRHYRQSKPMMTFGLGARRVGSVEAIKQSWQMLRRDCLPAIDHREFRKTRVT